MNYIFLLIAFLALAVSIGLVWYVRKLLKYTQQMLGDFINMSDEVSSYVEHLDNVYGMDRFYGDSTLEGLLEHTKELSQVLKDFVKEKRDLFEEESNDKENSESKKEA